MKKLMIFTGFICLFYNPIFSQINSQFRTDATLKNRSMFNNQKPCKLSDTIHFDHPFIGSLNNKRFFFLNFPKGISILGQIRRGVMPKVNFVTKCHV